MFDLFTRLPECSLSTSSSSHTSCAVGLLVSKYNFYPPLQVGKLTGENEVIVVFIFGDSPTTESILDLCKNMGCTGYERINLPENCQELPTFNHSIFLKCVTNDRKKYLPTQY